MTPPFRRPVSASTGKEKLELSTQTAQAGSSLSADGRQPVLRAGFFPPVPGGGVRPSRERWAARGDMRIPVGGALVAAAVAFASAASPVRMAVLPQIALPHNYYYRELYLPQLTTGPSSVAWTPDGTSLVYSMQGSLWRQRTDSTVAEQLTDDPGTDYQPDVSPDGRSVAFVRYDGTSMELMSLDLASRAARALTTGGAVNVEPRWSPRGDRLAFVSTSGTGHFLLHVADVRDGRLESAHALLADRRSTIPRYYYSAFDHQINPAWTRDGRELVFVSNREIAHGTGDIVRMPVDGRDRDRVLRHEETSWHARPDVSPD